MILKYTFSKGPIKMSKASIIGAGSVGSSCAYCLAQKGLVNEIVLLDIVASVAKGKDVPVFLGTNGVEQVFELELDNEYNVSFYES